MIYLCSLCMYMYVCTWYACTYARMYVCNYVCMYVYMWMCICIRLCICVCVDTCLSTCICTCTCVCACACAFRHVCMHACMHGASCTYLYVVVSPSNSPAAPRLPPQQIRQNWFCYKQCCLISIVTFAGSCSCSFSCCRFCCGSCSCSCSCLLAPALALVPALAPAPALLLLCSCCGSFSWTPLIKNSCWKAGMISGKWCYC